MMLGGMWRSASVRMFRLANGHRFASFGRNVYVFEGVEFYTPELIELGDDTIIQRHSYLAARASEPAGSGSRLVVGNGSNIGPRNHIFAHTRIEIGNKVLTAPNVFISDCTHEFTDPDTAILDQETRLVAPTKVGDHSWIGHGSAVIGCQVGRHCVVGSNSVVLSDLPDYSVAVGSPARVIKHYDPARQEWVRASHAPEEQGLS